METLYAMLIGVGIFAFGVGFAFLISRSNLRSDQIYQGLDLVEVIYAIIRSAMYDSQIKDSEELDKVFGIVTSTLDYMTTLVEPDRDKVIAEGISFGRELYIGFGYEMNEEREFLIAQVIKLAYNIYDNL